MKIEESKHSIAELVDLYRRANCKTIFLNCPASRKRDFPSRFRDAGRILIGYCGGIMVNLILKTRGCRT